MNEKFCETCKEELTNSAFILRTLTTLGYMDKDFCSKDCLINYIFKKFNIDKFKKKMDRKKWDI